MASFNSKTFRIRGEGATWFPVWNSSEIVTMRQPAAADEQIKALGGDVQRIDVVCRLSSTVLLAMYDEVLESGSLVLAFETASAFLESIDLVERVVSGVDEYEATLHFIKL